VSESTHAWHVCAAISHMHTYTTLVRSFTHTQAEPGVVSFVKYATHNIPCDRIDVQCVYGVEDSDSDSDSDDEDASGMDVDE
jgi:hypothetical protein